MVRLKGLLQSGTLSLLILFQFQMVRLKDELRKPNEAHRKRVSIPNGTIKRGSTLKTNDRQRSFNSKWYD